MLALITASNMWGVRGVGSAHLPWCPRSAFTRRDWPWLIIGGLVPWSPDAGRCHPVDAAGARDTSRSSRSGLLSVVPLLKVPFASGCSAPTGVEAIANSVRMFREARAAVARAQHTEVSRPAGASCSASAS